MVFAQVGGDVETGLAFHADVEQREIGPVLPGEQDRVVAVVGIDHVVAGLRQAVRHRGEHQAVVVDHEDLALAAFPDRHRPLLGPPPCAARGPV
jgi:hypothetical protein